MPDSAAETMSAEQNRGPALSATSDMPVIDLNATTIEEAAEPPVAQEGEEAQPTEQQAEGEGEEGRKPREDKRVPVGEVTKARAKQRAAEERAAAAEAERAALAKSLEALTVKQPEPAPDRPRRSDFDDPDVYEAAIDAYTSAKVEEAAREAVQKAETERAKKQSLDYQMQLSNRYKSSIEEFKADHPDFDEVFTDALTITPQMAIAIAESGASAAISYHLGQNPDEADRIAQLSPSRQIAEITKIELSLGSAPAKPAVKPKPAPIKPVGQRSGEMDPDPSNLSMDQYAERRQSQLRESRVH